MSESTTPDLSDARGEFSVEWYDPRHGGELRRGSVTAVQGGGLRALGRAPDSAGDDWAVLIRRTSEWEPTDRLSQAREFLVNLGVDLSSDHSQVGDVVTAVVISPEAFLGGRFRGVVDEVSPEEGVRFSMEILEHGGRTYRASSTVTSFVNSKGHRGVDESGREVLVVEGRLRSSQGKFFLNEGSELRLQVEPRTE